MYYDRMVSSGLFISLLPMEISIFDDEPPREKKDISNVGIIHR